MIDTMKATKVVGGLCGTLLVFLLGVWAAEAIYFRGGHGEEEQAYVIDTGEEESGGEEEGGGQITFAQAMRQAEASAGETIFRQCSSCHSIEDDTNGVGPHLSGVVGRDIASVADFSYSSALQDLEGSWTPKKLNPWITDPQSYASGTKMSYTGLDSVQDRANVITYLLEYSDYEYTPPEPAAGGGKQQAGQGGSQQGSSGSGQAQSGGESQEQAQNGSGQGQQGQGNSSGSGQARQAQSGSASGGGQAQGGAAPSGQADGSQMARNEAGSGGGQSSGSGQSQQEGGGVGGSPEFQSAWQQADAANGESIFRKCQACHMVEQKQNGVGPHLVGVLGRDVASLDDYSYSDALSGLDGSWTPGELSAWIAAPQDYAPGTKMGFAGLSDPQDRADVIAYLQQTGG